jgi:hypothetical protein
MFTVLRIRIVFIFIGQNNKENYNVRQKNNRKLMQNVRNKVGNTEVYYNACPLCKSLALICAQQLATKWE